MKYKALSHLKHDKTEYGLGDTVEMDEKQAKALVEDGVLRKIKSEPHKSPIETPEATTLPVKKGEPKKK